MTKSKEKQHLTMIVGQSFRPAGKLLLSTLANGTNLLLVPEPDNPYDSDAIKVMFGTLHLGYIPKTGGKYDVMHFGNKEVLELIAQGIRSVELTFSPQGNALILITAA